MMYLMVQGYEREYGVVVVCIVGVQSKLPIFTPVSQINSSNIVYVRQIICR